MGAPWEHLPTLCGSYGQGHWGSGQHLPSLSFIQLAILSSAMPELCFSSSGGVCVCVRVCREPLYL